MAFALADLAIELTEREKSLASRIDFTPGSGLHNVDSWVLDSDAMEELMHLLLERNAISLPRWKFFSDPECFIGGHGRSHLQTFERNGTRGNAIFRHGNFVRYLRYFLYGPDLPKVVIETFRQKVLACGTHFSGSDALQVAHCARGLMRSHCLDAFNAPDEFYKLSLDCGLGAGDARTVRDSAMKVR